MKPILATFAAACLCIGLASAAEPEADAPNPLDAAAAKAAAAERYKLPDAATSKDLMDFCEGIDKRQAADKDDEAAGLRAVRKACEQILVLEKGAATPAQRYATRRLLIAKLLEIRDPRSAEWLKACDAFIAFLTAPGYTPDDTAEALALGEVLERFHEKKAGEFYQTLGRLYEKSPDPAIAAGAKELSSKARRLMLLGNAMVVKGTKLDGKAFDLSEFKGKVILVDFWATWCPHCVHELPFVKQTYAGYHEKGFEVVAISADQTKEVVDEFVKKAKLPWVNLYDGQEGPALTYYSIAAYPTSILIDKDGKVVSLNARGENLTKLLKQLLGDPVAQVELPKAEAAKPDALQDAIKEAIRE